jgi:hypothetical protein
MALKNAFAALVTEPIALRLNQIGTILMPLGLAIDKASSSIRVNVTAAIASIGTVTSVTGVTTVTTVATCSTVTTCSTLTNQTNIGGQPAIGIVADSMNTRWASSLRGRIT